MKRINLYAYHQGLPEHRFDEWMSKRTIEELEKLGVEAKLILDRTDREGCYFKNIKMPYGHGALSIFENPDTGKFHVSDFNDDCTIVFTFMEHPDFAGATCGQYVAHRIDKQLPEHLKHKRHLIRPGYYPETVWQFGVYNREAIQKYRSSIKLSDELYFRGSIYPSRQCLRILSQYPRTVINDGKLPFQQFVQEFASYKMILGLGMSPLYSDICFRDVEMFGLGIPLMRPKMHVELHDPLIPDFHYVSVDIELDPITLFALDDKKAAEQFYSRYLEVINDDDFLNFVSKNALGWYEKNCTDPYVVYNRLEICNVMEL